MTFIKNIINNKNILIIISLLYFIISQILTFFLNKYSISNIEQINFDKYIFFIFSTCISAPIFEELIVRGWFSLRFRNILVLTLFLQFVIFVIDQTLYILKLYDYSIFQFLLKGIYVNILPIGFLNYPFIQGNVGSSIFHFFLQFPFVFVLATIILKLLIKFNFDFQTIKKFKFNLVVFSSFFFWFAHFQMFQKNPDPLMLFLFIPICILLPLIKIQKGIRYSIVLHSLANFQVNIIIFNILNLQTFAYYTICLIVVILQVMFLFGYFEKKSKLITS